MMQKDYDWLRSKKPEAPTRTEDRGRPRPRERSLADPTEDDEVPDVERESSGRLRPCRGGSRRGTLRGTQSRRTLLSVVWPEAGRARPAARSRGRNRPSTRSFCLDEVYAAVNHRGDVLGVAFVTGHDRLLCLDRRVLKRAYGPFGGAWRWSVYRLISGRRRRTSRDTRGLEGFSVDPACRGQGIGAAMIERIADDARREGARAIELNVGDTNPARHLYERAGFRVTRTGGVGPFARRLGFRRFIYYELELRPTVDRPTGEST